MDERQALAQLHAVLADLYPDPESILRLAVAAGLRESQIGFSNRTVDSWRSLLQEAQRRERVEVIIQIAQKEHPANSVLPVIRASYQERSARRGCSPVTPQVTMAFMVGTIILFLFVSVNARNKMATARAVQATARAIQATVLAEATSTARATTEARATATAAVIKVTAESFTGVYIVQADDTRREILEKYNITWELLAAANRLTETSVLETGQELRVPANVPAIRTPGIRLTATLTSTPRS